MLRTLKLKQKQKDAKSSKWIKYTQACKNWWAMQRHADSKKEPKRNMLDIKNTSTEMKNAFDRLINRLDMVEKNPWPRRYINRMLEKQKAKKIKTERKSANRISKDCEITTIDVT